MLKSLIQAVRCRLLGSLEHMADVRCDGDVRAALPPSCLPSRHLSLAVRAEAKAATSPSAISRQDHNGPDHRTRDHGALDRKGWSTAITDETVR